MLIRTQTSHPHANADFANCRDQCVLEGLAALLGMQLAPTLPMLKRGARRGGGRAVDSNDGSTPAESESRTERVRRRSSEFVISMKRTSGTFL